MEDELDKKLDKIVEEICERFYWTDGSNPEDVRRDEFPEWRKDIKQAFKDDGWLRSIDISLPAVTPYEPEPRMTGQEWYEKFLDEMLAVPIEDYSGSYVEVAQRIRMAAKKASGIHQPQPANLEADYLESKNKAEMKRRGDSR